MPAFYQFRLIDISGLVEAWAFYRGCVIFVKVGACAIADILLEHTKSSFCKRCLLFEVRRSVRLVESSIKVKILKENLLTVPLSILIMDYHLMFCFS